MCLGSLLPTHVCIFARAERGTRGTVLRAYDLNAFLLSGFKVFLVSIFKAFLLRVFKAFLLSSFNDILVYFLPAAGAEIFYDFTIF